MPKRALLSVSDKTGLVDFAKSLVAAGYELISTGGTAKALREAGLEVKDISDITGFPEMLDGRVKTLHPKVHGGLLFLRDNEEHRKQAQAHGIEPIDLVVVNLYPFEQTIAKPGVTLNTPSRTSTSADPPCSAARRRIIAASPSSPTPPT